MGPGLDRQRTAHRTLAAVLVTLLLALPAAADDHSPIKTTFSNGLTLIVKPEPEASTVAIEIFVRMGAADEDRNTQGLGHVLAGSILGGTRSRSPGKFARLFSEIGGSFHAAWQWDYLEIYGVTVPEMCDEAITLLADSLRKPAFYPAVVEYASAAALNQGRALESDPFSAAYAELRKSLYASGPYKRPFIGSPQTIRQVSGEQLQRLHRRCVVPGEIVISVAGRVAQADVSERVQRLFGNMRLAARDDKPEWDLPSEASMIVRNTGSATYVMLGFPAASVTSPDCPALSVANAMLGGNKSSLLFRRLREELGLGYQVGSLYPALRGPGHIVAFVGMDSGRATREAVDSTKEAVLEQIGVLTDGSFSDADVERAKRYLIGTYAVRHERVRDRAFHPGWCEVMGLGHQYDADYARKIKAVTVEDVRRVSERYLGVPLAAGAGSGAQGERTP